MFPINFLNFPTYLGNANMIADTHELNLVGICHLSQRSLVCINSSRPYVSMDGDFWDGIMLHCHFLHCVIGGESERLMMILNVRDSFCDTFELSPVLLLCFAKF